jgi:hypothetical protein
MSIPSSRKITPMESKTIDPKKKVERVSRVCVNARRVAAQIMNNMPGSWRISIGDPPGSRISSRIGHRGGLRYIFLVCHSIAKLDLRLVTDRTMIVLDGDDA